MRRLVDLFSVSLVLLMVQLSWGQSGLATLPGYDRYQATSRLARELGAQGRARVLTWSKDGASMEFSRGSGRHVISLGDMSIEKKADAKPKAAPPSPRGRRSPQRSQATQDRPGRAQQGTWVTAPDGKWIARYRDFNVVLERVAAPKKEPAEGAAEEQKPEPTDEKAADKKATDSEPTDSEPTDSEPADSEPADSEPADSEPADSEPADSEPADKETTPSTIPVTTGGSKDFRYGTCCWVYGEELRQSTAMWWSPDSRQLAFYEVDERHMQDYFLTGDNTELYTRILTERYPKPGTDNPFVGLLVYDLPSKRTVRIDVGGDRLQYVYNIRFSPDGKELLFSRTNRHQNVLEVMAADPETGKSRVVVAEKQPTWQSNRPRMQFLNDGQRFIWETERTGWKHFELRHIDGRMLNQLTDRGPYPVESIVRVDETANWLYYTACSGTNPNNAHLHRVRMDGSEYVRLTSKPLHHSNFSISPDNKWFVATCESAGTPAETALFDMQGKQRTVLAQPDMKKAEEAGMSYGELFRFKADDGTTDLYGILHKPANFDPGKKYPLLISVYGGPGSRGIRNRFVAANAYCEFGFLIATIANRGTTGRGKAFETATYQALGMLDIKDQADGVKFLCQRPYVDAMRVGVYGHSYGGYMSALALVKYPEVFHVGVAGAPVTDWKNYDTIYTERYMRTPQENPDGYRDGSCLTHAKNLKGHLLIMHGLIDDNVHPANTWQLVDLFQRENLRFDMLIFPRSKHGLGSGSSSIRWEYLCRHLKE